MKMQVVNQSGKRESEIDLPESFLNKHYSFNLVHQFLSTYVHNSHQNTKGQKNRSAVRGGGRKPWRQKGTGRARAGTIRSPLWVGGGRAFSSSNSNYSKKINKKVFKYALKSIFSTLAKDNRLIIVDKISLKEPKTKLLVQILSKLELENVLIIQKELENNLNLASRNIPNVDVVNLDQINPVNLISFDYVLMESKVLSDLERKLQ